MAKQKNLSFVPEYADYWAAQAVDADANVVNVGAAVLGAARVSLGFNRLTPSGTREDRAVFGLWVAKDAGGGNYAKPTAAECATLEPALDTLMAAIGPRINNNWTLAEYAWHVVTKDSPRDESGKGQEMGPAVRTTVKSVTGTGTGSPMPYQIASTVTLRTVSRKHWGRSYIPGINSDNLTGQYGRWSTSFVDAVANAFSALHDTWQGLSFQLGTYSMYRKAFLTPKTIECDDVPDIVRRRRPKQTNYRKLVS